MCFIRSNLRTCLLLTLSNDHPCPRIFLRFSLLFSDDNKCKNRQNYDDSNADSHVAGGRFVNVTVEKEMTIETGSFGPYKPTQPLMDRLTIKLQLNPTLN